MSWSGDFICSWNPGYSALSVVPPIYPEILELPGGITVEKQATVWFLDALSCRYGMFPIGMSDGLWLLSNPGLQQVNKESWMQIDKSAGEQEEPRLLGRHRFLAEISFSGITGELRFSCFDGYALITNHNFNEAGVATFSGEWKNAFRLPNVLGTELSPKCGTDYASAAEDIAGLDVIGMQMISSIIGVNLLTAEDDQIPSIYSYKQRGIGFLRSFIRRFL